MRVLMEATTTLLRRWGKAFRHYLVPLLVELAVYFALIYGVALVATASCRTRTTVLSAPTLLSLERAATHTEDRTLTCSIAKNVEGALVLEFAVLFERIKEKLSVNENDPALFVLGNQYRSLVDLAKSLKNWKLVHECEAVA